MSTKHRIVRQTRRVGIDPLFLDYDSPDSQVVRTIQKVGYVPGIFRDHWDSKEAPGIKAIWLGKEGGFVEGIPQDELSYAFPENLKGESGLIFISAKSRLYSSKEAAEKARSSEAGEAMDDKDNDCLVQYSGVVIDSSNGKIDKGKVCWNAGYFKTVTFEEGRILSVELTRKLDNFYGRKKQMEKEFPYLSRQKGTALDLFRAAIRRNDRLRDWSTKEQKLAYRHASNMLSTYADKL